MHLDKNVGFRTGITSHGTDNFINSISRQTDNPWPSCSQDINLPNYFMRGYLKDRVCENNPHTREEIIRKKIRQIAQEMLNRVVDKFIVQVVAALSYSSVVHGTNIVLITEKV